jgi:hypothetical protein
MILLFPSFFSHETPYSDFVGFGTSLYAAGWKEEPVLLPSTNHKASAHSAAQPSLTKKYMKMFNTKKTHMYARYINMQMSKRTYGSWQGVASNSSSTRLDIRACRNNHNPSLYIGNLTTFFFAYYNWHGSSVQIATRRLTCYPPGQDFTLQRITAAAKFAET